MEQFSGLSKKEQRLPIIKDKNQSGNMGRPTENAQHSHKYVKSRPVNLKTHFYSTDVSSFISWKENNEF